MTVTIQDFLQATTVQATVDLLERLEAGEGGGPAKYRLVGDREGNLATINMGTDPAAGVVERITNAIDAVLERKWHEHRNPLTVKSPRQASKEWFGIENGTLEKHKAADSALRVIASGVRVTLRDSNVANRPTVDIQDHGIGLSAEEFPNTILSLNGSVKVNKMFLAGAFGQGGSTALSYSHFTVIISKKWSPDGSDSGVAAATVVLFDPRNIETDKHGVYQYIVSSKMNAPFVFECTQQELQPGTLIRHVAMDIGKYKGVMTGPTGSLWWLAHHYMFDPVMPFIISDERKNLDKVENRTVTGNARRLTFNQKTEYRQSATRTFKNGTVVIKYWVITPEESQGFITNFCQASKPIIITFNGQKQGELPNTIIKNDLKLPYLDKYIVIQIDCDLMDGESRRQLFATTRESLRETSLLDELRELVVETLQDDEELRRLDQERKKSYIQRPDAQAAESLRKRLSKRVEEFVAAQGKASSGVTSTGGGGGGSTAGDPQPGTPHTPKVPIPVNDPPTFIEIINPNPRKVYVGRPFTLKFKTDAAEQHFETPDSFLVIVKPVANAQYTGTTTVNNGYGTVFFKSSSDVKPGETAEVTLEVRPKHAAAVRTSTILEFVAAPEEVGTGGQSEGQMEIAPQWVNPGDKWWNDKDWNDQSVAEVILDDKSVTIYVSAGNKRLNNLIARAVRRDATSDSQAVQTVKDFYLEHISFHAFVARIAEQKVQEEMGTTEEVTSDESLNKFKEKELQRVNELVCGIMDQMFDALLAGVAAQETV